MSQLRVSIDVERKQATADGVRQALFTVAEDDKNARLQWLQCDIDRLQADFLAKSRGTTMDVLFEKPGQRAGQIVGRSPYLNSVHVMAPHSLIGEIRPVTITDVGTNTLFGTLVHPHAAEPMLAEA